MTMRTSSDYRAGFRDCQILIETMIMFSIAAEDKSKNWRDNRVARKDFLEEIKDTVSKITVPEYTR